MVVAYSIFLSAIIANVCDVFFLIYKIYGTNFSLFNGTDVSKYNVKKNKEASNILKAPNYLIYQDSTSTKPKWYKTDTDVSLLVAGDLITVGTIMHLNYNLK